MLIVQKFGGSSLADAARLRAVAALCLERRRVHELVVVVSAMGDTTDGLSERARELLPDPPLRELDALVTTGEQQAAALLVMAMRELGLDAVSLTGWQAGILTDRNYGAGEIRFIAPDRVRLELARGRVPVVTGFQGVCAAGDITSLGRGGSDTTAVALAAALESELCEIYSDVDGVYTADPRLVPEARRLDAVDSRDMLALARAGAQVLHPRAVELAMANHVPLRLLSSFSPGQGTLVRRLPDEARPRLAGITGRAEAGSLTLAGAGADAACLAESTLLLARSGIPVQSGAVRGALGERRDARPRAGAGFRGHAPAPPGDDPAAVRVRYFLPNPSSPA